MESTEEEFSSFTTKGRRTKRQRSILAVSASSSYRGGVGGGASGGSSDVSSSTDEHDVMSEVTETEEEDTANCLILLAQGVQKLNPTKSTRKKSNTNTNTNANTAGNNNITGTTTSTSNINNNNISQYECKTCNKIFTSFQALGGHRTSHKKVIKPAASVTLEVDHGGSRGHDRDEVVNHDNDGDDHEMDRLIFTTTSSSKKILFGHDDNSSIKVRVHECSICGSEFPSGQALGGHMRRHRAASTAANSNRPMMADTTTTTTTTASTVVIDTGGPRNILTFDLNLPAPDDHLDQDDDTKFVHHVLPTPAPLVDCHY